MEELLVQVPEEHCEWFCSSDGTVFVAEPLRHDSSHCVYLFSKSGQMKKRLEDTELVGRGTNLVVLGSREKVSVVFKGQVYETDIFLHQKPLFPFLATDVDVPTRLTKTRVGDTWLYWSEDIWEYNVGITPEGVVVSGSSWDGVTVEYNNQCATLSAEPYMNCALLITPDGNVVALFQDEKRVVVWRPRPDKISVEEYYLSGDWKEDETIRGIQTQNGIAFFGISSLSPRVLLINVRQRCSLRYAILPVQMEGEEMLDIFLRSAWLAEQGGNRVVCFSAVSAPQLFLRRYTPKWIEASPFLMIDAPWRDVVSYPNDAQSPAMAKK